MSHSKEWLFLLLIIDKRLRNIGKFFRCIKKLFRCVRNSFGASINSLSILEIVFIQKKSQLLYCNRDFLFVIDSFIKFNSQPAF